MKFEEKCGGSGLCLLQVNLLLQNRRGGELRKPRKFELHEKRPTVNARLRSTTPTRQLIMYASLQLVSGCRLCDWVTFRPRIDVFWTVYFVLSWAVRDMRRVCACFAVREVWNIVSCTWRSSLVRLVPQTGPCLIESMILFTVSYVAARSALDNPLAATAWIF